jgi:hypothetical protein
MSMIYTDQQLINRVETTAAGFTGWKKGIYLIAVRSSADIPDAFDDKAYVFDCKKDGERPSFFMVATCTTHPGVDVLKHFATKKGYNKAGAPLLKSDTIVYESHTHGKHQGKYNAYRQTKPFPYSRDTDKDNKAEEQDAVTVGNISAHVHRASATKTSKINHNWSAGCIVMNDPNKFNAFMTFMAKRPLSLCILNQF